MQTFRTYKPLFALVLVFVVLIQLVPTAAAEAPAVSMQSPSKTAYASSVFAYGALLVVLKTFSVVANIFQFALKIPITLSVIEPMWKIVRDFTNMFFILILIIMAFATIFDVSGYQLNVQLLARLLLVAVLINFSLVLAILFIDGINVVNQTLLQGLGNIGERFATIFSSQQLLGGSGQHFVNLEGCFVENSVISCVRSAVSYSDAATWEVAFQVFFSLILAIIALASLFIPTVFAFIRIPFLWFLVIFAPMAGVSSIMPATKELWSKWTREFVSWSIYLPINLFFLYFGMYFLAQQNTVVSRLQTAFPASFWTQPIQGLQYSFQFLFFYIIAGIVLWFSTAMALAASRIGGTMAMDYGVKGGQWAANNIPWLSPAYRGAKQGIGEQATRVRQEGVFGYGGLRNIEKRQAFVAQGFGARGAVESQRNEAIKYFKGQLEKDNLNVEQLRGRLKSSRLEERLASYQILRDKKDLQGAELLEAYQEFKNNVGGISATNFAKDIDFKKDLEKNERMEWFSKKDAGGANIVSREVRRKLALVMADEGELRIDPDGTDRLKEASNLFKEGNEQRDFLMDKASKKNLVHAYRLLKEKGLKDVRNKPDNLDDYLDKYLETAISKRKPEDLLGLIDGDFYDPETNEIKDNSKLKPDQRLLMNKIIEVMSKNKELTQRLLSHPTATAEHQLVINALNRAALKRAAARPAPTSGGTTPPPSTPPSGGSAGTIRAENTNDNVIDLRNT